MSVTLPPTVIKQYLSRIKWRRATLLDQRDEFYEKFPEDWITAFLLSGKGYFDRDILVARKLELMHFKPWKIFTGGAQIYHQRVPGRRYLIGGDVATGRTVSSDDTDYCAAVVLDQDTGEEMAAYRARVSPQDFAYDLSDLGEYFNNAMIGIERTGDGGTTILVLQGECRYGAIYKHRDWHKRDKKVIELEGFPTTKTTRPIACNFVQHHIMEHPELIWDAGFIDEALVFVRNEKGKPEAQPGAHDDRVSARWIAHSVRRAMLGWWDPVGAKSERYNATGQAA